MRAREANRDAKLKRAAIAGALWSVCESVGIQLMSFVLFLVFARLIEPNAFGIIQLAVTVLGLLTIFVEQGFSLTIIQRRELTKAALDTAFWIGVASAAAVALVLCASADAIALVYGSRELAGVLRALALSLPLAAACSVQVALFVRVLDFRPQALRRLIAVLGGGLVGIVMAFAGFGIWSLVARLLVETVLDCVVVWRISDFRPSLRVSRPEARALMAFGSRVVGSNLLGYLDRRADDLLIGYVLGPVALAYYAVAFRALLLVHEVALRSAQRIAVPLFAELQDDPPRMRSALYAAVEVAAAIGCPVFLGLSAIAPELCATLFGPKWAPAIPAMRVLGLAGIGLSVSLYTDPLLVALGKADAFFRFNLATAAVNLLASLVAVRWGIVAMAIAYVARGYVMLPFVLRIARRAIDADTTRLLRLMLAPAFASIAMAGCIELVRRCVPLPDAARLLLLIAAGAIVYLGVMSVVARATVERLLAVARLTRGAQGAEG